MTSEYEPNEEGPDRPVIKLEEIIGQVRSIHRKLDDIITRLKDSYHLLRDVLDATSENGVTAYDLYQDGDECY